MQTILQPAYLLYIRPYRETSALAEILTRDFGRISVVIRGMRQPKSRYRSIRVFTPLLVSYQGKSDLLNITHVESTQMPYALEENALFCGFYLNELLIRLLLSQDPYPSLFSDYEQTLQMLAENKNEVEPALRQFEWSILVALGYGFSLDQAEDQKAVFKENDYLFDPKRGLIYVPRPLKTTFKGEHLLNFKQRKWSDPETSLAVKRLMQLALTPLLGSKPLKTRAFFKEVQA